MARSRQLLRIAAPMIAVALWTGACSADSGPAGEQPEYTAAAAVQDFHFESIESMAATADLVIMGTVEAVGRGRETYACDDPAGNCAKVEENYTGQLRAVTVAVDATLSGSVQVGETVTLEEEGYDRKGNPFEIAGAPWSRVGDRGAYFLRRWPSQPEGSYYLVHPVGRILTHRGSPDGSGTPSASEHAVSFAEGELADLVETVPSEDVHDFVRNAVATAEAEGVRPQEPLEYLESSG